VTGYLTLTFLRENFKRVFKAHAKVHFGYDLRLAGGAKLFPHRNSAEGATRRRLSSTF
jgi:hypothetical protein